MALNVPLLEQIPVSKGKPIADPVGTGWNINDRQQQEHYFKNGFCVMALHSLFDKVEK